MFDDLDFETARALLSQEPGEVFNDFPKVILVHDSLLEVQEISKRLIQVGIFPFIFTDVNSAVRAYARNDRLYTECIALMAHKDISKAGTGSITNLIGEIEKAGGMMMRRIILSGEFFNAQHPNRKCVQFAAGLEIDAAYDPTQSSSANENSYLPDWIVRLLGEGLLLSKELKFRGNEDELVTNEARSNARLKYIRELKARTGIERV